MKNNIEKRGKESFCYLALDLIEIQENFNNLMKIYDFLDKIITKTLGFRGIHKPVLIPYYHGKVENDCGISCYAFFEGGYATLHIFEKRRIAYFDIVSSCEFNENAVVENVLQELQTDKYNLHNHKMKKSVRSKNVFGPHYFASGKTFKNFNVDKLLGLQEKIINEIDMTPIINPVVIKTKEETRVFIAIAESHISLTYHKGCLKVDIFSCKMFDTIKLKNVLSSVMTIENEIIFTRLDKVNKK